MRRFVLFILFGFLLAGCYPLQTKTLPALNLSNCDSFLRDKSVRVNVAAGPLADTDNVRTPIERALIGLGAHVIPGGVSYDALIETDAGHQLEFTNYQTGVSHYRAWVHLRVIGRNQDDLIVVLRNEEASRSYSLGGNYFYYSGPFVGSYDSRVGVSTEAITKATKEVAIRAFCIPARDVFQPARSF